MRTTAPLSLDQLERHLYAATHILRGRMDAWSYKDYFFGLLFLKRCSDAFDERRGRLSASAASGKPRPAEAQDHAESREAYADAFYVPQEARWSFLCASPDGQLGARLDQALAALEGANPSLAGVLLGHIRFSGKASLPPQALRALLQHFSRYRLRDADFESPDLLGAAYEYLLAEFADDAGKRGGEFYTPGEVAQMMVRLLRPAAGMRVYDPCAGSGGMLIPARRYAQECGCSPKDLRLYGQESSGQAWTLCKMNMLLHACPQADIRLGDSLANPRHVVDERLMRFDRVISNPPFAQRYGRAELAYPERFRYGFCPEAGKRAELMFVQHMLAVLSPHGMLATVVPHGVLFRGGAEQEIRRGLIEDDVLEAVIGLPANLFYGTGIPACILVVRARGAKPPERRGHVLFINAEADFTPGRGQNRLSPAQCEKIIDTFEGFRAAPNFAAVVGREELAQHEWNLNLRLYADSAPSPEPQDVRAHLLGGVPVGEAEAKRPLFAAHGLALERVFLRRPHDERYLDFHPALTERRQIALVVAADEAVRTREAHLSSACAAWWAAQSGHLLALLGERYLMGARSELLRSFQGTLGQVGLLDRAALTGVFASWWDALRYDLRPLAARGFEGLLDTWVAAIVDAGEGPREGRLGQWEQAVGHRLLATLLPDLPRELSAAAAALTELEIQLRPPVKGEEEDEDEGPRQTEGEIRATKRSLAERRKALLVLKGALPARLEAARAALSPAACRQAVLDILLSELLEELEGAVAGQRRQLVAVVENVWDKYRVSMREIQAELELADQRMQRIMRQLGYGD